MANEEQLSILRQGVEAWNKWRGENPEIIIDLREADLRRAHLDTVNLSGAELSDADLIETNLRGATLVQAHLARANLIQSNLWGSDLSGAHLIRANLSGADFSEANLRGAKLDEVNFLETELKQSNFAKATISSTVFGNSDLSEVMGLDDVTHWGPSTIGVDTIVKSKGNIPKLFLQGCGLSDWEIEAVKLYNPDLSNDEIAQVQYRVYELRATQALQISPLFVSYSHGDGEFVDKLGTYLTKKGVRYWRDIHDLKSGRMEKQIDRAIRQNPTVLLVLSEHSLSSDWVEHEVRTARGLEKEMERDVLCPVALDDSWKNSRWPKRVMEQIMEYNILDFSEWKDESKFGNIFNKLIGGLELFYKG